ncbi:MAG: tRNA uridine-5-carboxymethylaminomethyl(34) synthesis GTPase MnmE [Oscillospiraceae bacterium]|nr:tRNA uridine-5-carboxymethylaminomethyl(34) synthesis GTPase MnmE [Oscillospiraceae bacterium]
MADNATIAAIATAHGVAAIAVVRISGDRTREILQNVFLPRNGTVADMRPNVLTRGVALSDGAAVDDCAAIVFNAPHSYTGEDAAEIHCHGSPIVAAEILQSVLHAGARMATAGEFTRRAFLNGKLDLAQAEAVAELIDAETVTAAKNAASQLLGAVSRHVSAAYDRLLDPLAHFHAAVDYTDEDIDAFDSAKYAELLSNTARELDALAATHERGRVMKNGVPCAIIGRPNAGKSSLLNAIVGYDRAIVTAEPGTTRDTIEERVAVAGTLLRLTDTAGLRDAVGEAERLGVRRSEIAARGASVVIAVFDGSEPFSPDDLRVTDAIPDRAHRIAAVNKSDLPQRFDASQLIGFDAIVHVSAVTGDGVTALTDAIAAAVPSAPDAAVGEIITSARQYDAITRAATSVRACADALRGGVTPDAALSELETALGALGEVLGRRVRDDTVDRVFANFCVGK